jgi:hypothetical protein
VLKTDTEAIGEPIEGPLCHACLVVPTPDQDRAYHHGLRAAARPIEDVLAELARGVPAEDWKKLPSDLTDNLDHYLYGTPKR